VADYYTELATAFGLTIDMLGPVFGNEALLEGDRSFARPGDPDRRRLSVSVARQL
jgi:hypothetical protein